MTARRTGLLGSLAAGLALAGLPVDQASASPNGVMISELRTCGPAGGNDEVVELFNASNSDVNVSGYKLQGCASSGGAASDRTVVPAGTVLKPGQHYLFTNSGSGGYSGSVSGDRTYSTGFTDFQTSNASGARIVDTSGTVIDGVGSPTSPGPRLPHRYRTGPHRDRRRRGRGRSGQPVPGSGRLDHRGRSGPI